MGSSAQTNFHFMRDTTRQTWTRLRTRVRARPVPVRARGACYLKPGCRVRCRVPDGRAPGQIVTIYTGWGLDFGWVSYRVCCTFIYLGL